MFFQSKPFSSSFLSLPLMITILLIFAGPAAAASSSDYTNLIFKGCASQKFQEPSGIYSQSLKSLFDSLVSQSSQKGYSTATSGDASNAITGLYQCRGDLTTTQCHTCLSKIPGMVDKLCGRVIAARVQLSGCYLTYEVSGFKQAPGTELVYKVCGSTQASSGGANATAFEEKRDAAFQGMVNGVVKNGNFYTGSYQSLFVLAQCEGDLSSGDCGDCVKSGVESVKAECGDTVSGQVYLNKCFISYSYYPNGVPIISTASGTEQHTERTVAIAVGGVAALGFAIVCLMFLKSLLKKQRRAKHYEGWY